jgi:DNA primase
MDRALIDNIIENNNIVDVISSYFPLKKAGVNYKARCPFHEEKTPSFTVSENKQIYKCFGCGKAGNVVSFIMDYEKISFIEAMKKLAARVGITIEEPQKESGKRSKRDLIYKVYLLATQHFRENLEKYGTNAREYLVKRGFGEDIWQEFEIGYALDSYNGLKSFLLKNNINDRILEQTGLFTRGERGLFDTFRNRLMFPIHSTTGKVVAFGGRILLKDQAGGKYINSPTTEIYTKGNELYGLHKTRYEIQKQDFVLICEGYTDFLRLYEKGFTNSVASLGTALTGSQINILSRFTKNLYIVYDGDPAGRKAAVRAAGNALSSGLTVKIVPFERNIDPDGFFATGSRDEFKEKINSAETLAQFIFNDNVMGLNQTAKVDLLVDLLSNIADPLTREFQVKEISDVFRISEKSVLSRVRQTYKKPEKNINQIPAFKYEEERDLLKLLLNEKTSLKKVAQEIDSSYFLFKIYREIYDYVCTFFEQNEKITGILNSVEDEIIRSTIAEILLEEVPELEISEVLQTVKLRKFEKDLTEINQMIYKAENKHDLQLKKDELKKKILGMNSKIVRKTLY